MMCCSSQNTTKTISINFFKNPSLPSGPIILELVVCEVYICNINGSGGLRLKINSWFSLNELHRANRLEMLNIFNQGGQ